MARSSTPTHLPWGGNVTSSGVSGISGNFLDLGGSDRTFDVSDTLTVNAAISGSGGLTKNGLGTLVLNQASYYAGPTTINGGILQSGANEAVPTGSNVSINSATWDLS